MNNVALYIVLCCCNGLFVLHVYYCTISVICVYFTTLYHNSVHTAMIPI